MLEESHLNPSDGSTDGPNDVSPGSALLGFLLEIHLIFPMMTYLRVYVLKTHLNHMMNMHWVILMKMKMEYLRARHWGSEGEALGSEEYMVLGTGELLRSTLGATNNVKIGNDAGTELGSLVDSL